MDRWGILSFLLWLIKKEKNIPVSRNGDRDTRENPFTRRNRLFLCHTHLVIERRLLIKVAGSHDCSTEGALHWAKVGGHKQRDEYAVFFFLSLIIQSCSTGVQNKAKTSERGRLQLGWSTWFNEWEKSYIGGELFLCCNWRTCSFF